MIAKALKCLCSTKMSNYLPEESGQWILPVWKKCRISLFGTVWWPLPFWLPVQRSEENVISFNYFFICLSIFLVSDFLTGYSFLTGIFITNSIWSFGASVQVTFVSLPSCLITQLKLELRTVESCPCQRCQKSLFKSSSVSCDMETHGDKIIVIRMLILSAEILYNIHEITSIG